MSKIAIAAALSSALMSLSAARENRVFGFDNIRRAIQRQKRAYAKGGRISIAQRNRHTGQPHEHKREIALRLRQREARS